jgi:hypothetical protein
MVDKGARTKVDGVSLYGGTDTENKLVGSTAAWNSVFVGGQGYSRICCLALWDSALARAQNKEWATTITAKTLAAVRERVFLPACEVDIVIV